MFKRIAVALMCVGALVAQDFDVMILEPTDTAALKAAYAKVLAAKEEFDKVKFSISKKYYGEANGLDTVSNQVKLQPQDVEFGAEFKVMRTIGDNLNPGFSVVANTGSINKLVVGAK